VTHSKGRGAPVDPESDLGYEKREWDKKRSRGRKSKQNTSPNTSTEQGLLIV